MATDTKLPVIKDETEVARRAFFGFPDSPSAAEVRRWARQEGFLAAYAETGLIYASAENVGCSARSHEAWLSSDVFGYQKRFQSAQAQYLENIVSELSRRAFEGIDKPIYYKGKRIDTIKDYSDILGMFLVKQRDPSFRDSFTLVLDSRDSKDLIDELRRAGEARPAIVDGESKVIEPKPTSEPPEAT